MNLYLSLNYYEIPPQVLMNVSLILRSLRAALVHNSERGPGETPS